MHGHKAWSDELQIGQSGGGKIDTAGDGDPEDIHKKRRRHRWRKNSLISHRKKAVDLSFSQGHNADRISDEMYHYSIPVISKKTSCNDLSCRICFLSPMRTIFPLL